MNNMGIIDAFAQEATKNAMAYYYAQVNESGICIGVSQLSGEVNAPNMIRLNKNEFERNDIIGHKYENGVWSAVEETEEM